MPTLFERLSGIGLTGEVNGEKMSIHSFCGAINEVRRGKFTQAQVVAMFALTPEQVTTATVLKDYIVAAPDKNMFVRVFKDCLYMAESGVAYLTQAEFVARLQTEITDQGGTVP
jgi:hypothetical protein